MDDKQPAKNSMQVLPDDIILLVQTGYQTAASSMQFEPQIDELVRQRRRDKKPALIMSDISSITGHDTKVRDLAHDMLKSDFDAMAVVTGGNVTTKLIGNWLVKLVGVGKRVEFFEKQDEALTWLRSHSN